jgi:hypothetical protein
VVLFVPGDKLPGAMTMCFFAELIERNGTNEQQNSNVRIQIIHSKSQNILEYIPHCKCCK